MIGIVRHHVIPAAFSVLPEAMRSPEAARLLLAIGWQESRLAYRVQIGGPARGLWQFEQNGGVRGVLMHVRTNLIAREAMRELGYRHPMTPFGCYQAIEHNDVLACVFARLLLWTDPAPMPDDESGAWAAYIRTWRPGKPHIETWPDAWTVAA